jgi:hypothetical protein
MNHQAASLQRFLQRDEAQALIELSKWLNKDVHQMEKGMDNFLKRMPCGSDDYAQQ